MSRNSCFSALLSILILAGISPEGRGAEHRAPGTPDGRSTGLTNVLELFATDAGRQWRAYQHVNGVSWRAKQPEEYGDGKFDLSGHLLLIGFGLKKLPNGKAGIEYAEIEGNEGQSGVTLNGTQKSVLTLSVKKFYFSENYEEVLRKQLPVDFNIRKIATHCRQRTDASIDGSESFFEIKLPGLRYLYVEASLEDGGKYAPGYTVFDFGRERPAEKIQQLECKLI
jgi:hypothetical protein